MGGRTTFEGHRIAKGKAWSVKAFLEQKIKECVIKSNATHVRKKELLKIATDEQIRNLFSIGIASKETVERWLAGDVMPMEDRHFDNPDEPILDFDEELQDLQFEKKKRSGKTFLLRRPAEDDEINEAEVNPQQPAGEEAQNEDQSEDEREGKTEEDEEAQIEQFQVRDFVEKLPDVWRLNQEQRRILPEYWLKEIKKKYRNQLQTLSEQYEAACREVNEIEQEIKLSLLRRANVVGLTTTIAARSPKILQALKSEIVIVEEAAEVLEGHVLASLNSCVKHLVLIGDHLELCPSTAVYQLGVKHKT
ncbi:hypothetical protein R1flu_013370 [Riccia fluitans]|uniref:DNA2/NAM7 helicase helicase domain-containing protein n=1 Tax=Riccia fluitans TaxID=41844 RepID=A0ABD1YD18_9MARC